MSSVSLPSHAPKLRPALKQHSLGMVNPPKNVRFSLPIATTINNAIDLSKRASARANPFASLPPAVRVHILGSMLSGKDGLNLQLATRPTSKDHIPSELIKKYKLEALIDKYLFLTCAKITEAQKARAIDQLMLLARTINKVEKLPTPTYETINAFFEEVEARNLIRMFWQMDTEEEVGLIGITEMVPNFEIPKTRKETIEKADLLREWIRITDIFATIHGRLNFSGTGFTLLPKEIGLMTTLEELFLNDNHLSVLPRELFTLPALEVLGLVNNRLTVLPPNIALLQGLHGLTLEKNRLRTLPREIGELRSLQALYLSDNLLEELPEELCQLKALHLLFASNNFLSTLPVGIGELDHLKQFKFERNGLLGLPRGFKNSYLTQMALTHQNKKKQLTTVLAHLVSALQTKADLQIVSSLLNKIENILDAKTRSKLHRCLFDVCNRTLQHPTFRAKLRDPQFGRKAFLDPKIPSRLKIAAIELFKKTLKRKCHSI